MASFDDFMKLDIRVGTILSAKNFEKARKPAYQLEVDFGEELGVKRSSAQITQQYAPEELVGKQVLAVVNFPPRQIANFFSEVLVLGTKCSFSRPYRLSVFSFQSLGKPGLRIVRSPVNVYFFSFKASLTFSVTPSALSLK